MKYVLFIISVLGVVFLSVSLWSQERTSDALTGADPTAGYTTGVGQAVEPIIKSPIGSPPSATPLTGEPPKGLTTPYEAPGQGQYYQENVRQEGNYYQEGVKVDGTYQPPDVTGQQTTPQE